MTRLLFLFAAVILPVLARAQTNPTPNWCSYQTTGNPSCIQSAPDVASQIGQRVFQKNGYSQGQTVDSGTIKGGTATGTDTTAANALATSGTTTRTHALHYSDTTNVMDFAAVATVKTDNSPAIQAAINAACAKVLASSGGVAYPSGASPSGGDVFIPQGKYAVVGTINWTCPVHLHGAGRGTTTLVWEQSGTGNLLNMAAPLGDGGRYWRNGAVHDLDIVNVGSQTGAAIKVSQCKECEIYNIGTYNLYRSVVVFAGFHINLHDFDFQQGHAQARNGVISGTEAFSTAIEIYGSDNNGGTGCTASDLGNCLTRGDIMNIYSGSVDAGGMNSTTEPTDCIYHHDFFGTVWVKNLNCNQTRIGYNVRCDNSQTLGACPAFIHLDRLENETNNVAGTDNNHGILGDNFAQLECFSCQLGGSQAGGAVVALSGSRFHAGQFQWYGGTVQNAKSACVVSYIDGVTWVGGYVLRCGNGGDSGSKWGIQFSTGAVNNYVSGTQFCHDGLGATTTDMRPVLMANTANYTAVDHINIHNCAGGSSNQSTVSGNVNTITNEMGP